MSLYGVHWKLDGVPAAFVIRGRSNGRYQVVFEREYAELPAIEAIHWEQPTVEHLAEAPEVGLPDGYGFQVENITYDSASRSYTVTVRTARQYLGDVTGYQAQVAELQSAAAEKDSTIAQQAADLEEQAATIAQQGAAIEALEAAGNAETLKAELRAAYTEGVESNG